MHKIKNNPISNDDAVNKQYVDDEISKINAKLNLSLEKTIVCIIDDDGTNRTSDAYTGMTTWLNDKGIPMNFAICYDTIGTSGKYTVTELQELQANGNDILIHGNPELVNLTSETEVITEIESALQFHTDNGLKPTNIYVYPQGLNSDGTLTATQVKEIVGRYFDYGLNVNIAIMSGEDTRGLWNKVPLVDKLNIARMEVSSTKGFDANKSEIDACIENKGLLILFTHSFMSQFTSGGYDEFQKIINYLLTKDVEFLTVSNALDKVDKTELDKTELDKKVDKTNILSTISASPTNEQVYNAKFVNSVIQNINYYYNADTDKDDTKARKTAILYVINKLKNKYIDNNGNNVITPTIPHTIFTIRYNGGYYYTYILTTAPNSINILEFCPHENFLNMWTKTSGNINDIILEKSSQIFYNENNTVITKKFTNETNYKLVKLSYVIRNGVCYMKVQVKCINPHTGSGYHDVSTINALTIPTPETASYKLLFDIESNTGCNFYIGSSGVKMRGGKAGAVYMGEFSYPVAEQ